MAVLKQSVGASAGTPVASAWEASATPKQYTGAEKRASVRYKCEAIIEMREEGCDTPTVAAVTDVSMHGCYVDTHATYPVGTTLHLKLDAHGLSVQIKGVVRVNYPYVGMGIALTEVSEEGEIRLKEILRTAARLPAIDGSLIASSLPTKKPLGVLPVVSATAATVHSLIAFFLENQMLTREGFLRILWKSNPASRSAE